jgi:hypothetical protein
MHILIANCTLASRTGTEIVVRDLRVTLVQEGVMSMGYIAVPVKAATVVTVV